MSEQAERSDEKVTVLTHEGAALTGSTVPGDAIPMCWKAEGVERGATDDDWLLSLDHEAIREGDDGPGSFRLSRQGEVIDCPDCIAWRHA